MNYISVFSNIEAILLSWNKLSHNGLLYLLLKLICYYLIQDLNIYIHEYNQSQFFSIIVNIWFCFKVIWPYTMSCIFAVLL